MQQTYGQQVERIQRLIDGSIADDQYRRRWAEFLVDQAKRAIQQRNEELSAIEKFADLPQLHDELRRRAEHYAAVAKGFYTLADALLKGR
jgi:hypothetical protein